MTAPSRVPSSGEWVAVLFLAYVVLQRFAVPGTPISLLLPVTGLWIVAGLRAGVVVLDRTRWLLWLAALASTAVASVLGSMLGRMPIASLSSWGLLLVSWAPLVFIVARVDRFEYLTLLRRVSTICVGLAVLCLITTATQAVGLGYVDVLGEIAPHGLLLDTFNTNSPIAYGESVVKANGWIGLEPSLVSLELGAGLLAALLSRRPWWVPTLILAGMLATLSGSGVVLVLVGLVAVLFSRLRSTAVKLLGPAAVVLVVLLVSPVGSTFLDRAGEFSEPGSSGSIRGVEPYEALVPMWTAHLDGMLLGYGPGSSQTIINAPGVAGLIVPVPAKVFFDYGLVAGLVLAFFMISCHLRSPSRSLALALFVAYWSIQPAATLMLLIGQIGIFSAFWAPATDVLEDQRPVDVPAPRRPGRTLVGADARPVVGHAGGGRHAR